MPIAETLIGASPHHGIHGRRQKQTGLEVIIDLLLTSRSLLLPPNPRLAGASIHLQAGYELERPLIDIRCLLAFVKNDISSPLHLSQCKYGLGRLFMLVTPHRHPNRAALMLCFM
ncbi:hypothetical protein AcW1_001157 [Taiwanofungus camphoratus]|nr:hypothetical protein AcV5_005070 [Antrodia cinnamomea]KAI0964311.1 hypothetical protein AcW1_001157 [Antrodia cinnamomea]